MAVMIRQDNATSKLYFNKEVVESWSILNAIADVVNAPIIHETITDDQQCSKEELEEQFFEYSMILDETEDRILNMPGVENVGIARYDDGIYITIYISRNSSNIEKNVKMMIKNHRYKIIKS
jgi:hypothetical protein